MSTEPISIVPSAPASVAEALKSVPVRKPGGKSKFTKRRFRFRGRNSRSVKRAQAMLWAINRRDATPEERGAINFLTMPFGREGGGR